MVTRRHVVEDHVSHDRWLVSYADFITLLFAFFVVMYSISQVNEGKYRVLSNTLSDTFNVIQEDSSNTPELTLDPIQIGEITKSNPLNFVELRSGMIIEEQAQTDDIEDEKKGKSAINEDTDQLPDEFRQISDSLDEALGYLINQDLITIRGDEQWLEIELKSALLFDSGNAILSIAALELLGIIIDTLQNRSNLIRVEGFTDSLPINTSLFPSNWELSTARAAAVVHVFVEEGIDPSRLAAIGYSQFQPVAENTTEQGRAANRRVVLRIAKQGELRPTLNVVNVSSEPNATDKDTAVQTSENQLRGVQTIELDDGGLLFTSEPDSRQRQ